MLKNTYKSYPNEKGYFGQFGGRYVSETLMPLILEVEKEYEKIKKDENFIDLDVWLGKKDIVGGYVKEDIYKTFPKARKKFLSAIVEYNGPIKAPIKKDQEIGLLKISYKGDLIDEYPVYAVEKVKRVNIFSRIIQSINYLIWGDV